MQKSGARADYSPFYFTGRGVISNALCLYGFCNLLSTHYNSYVAKVCTFPFLSEGVLAQVALSHFLSEAMHYFLC